MFDFKSQVDAKAVAKEVIKQIMQGKQEENKEKKLTRRSFLTQNLN